MLKYLTQEFDRITCLVKERNLTFVRYGDGEAMLALGKPVGPDTQAARVDRWSSQGGPTLLGQDMAGMLSRPEWYYGIPCRCCNDAFRKTLLLQLGHVPGDHITFANLFVNAAFPLFESWVVGLDRPVVLVTNHRGLGRSYPLSRIAQHVGLPDDCVPWWQENRDKARGEFAELAAKSRDTVFLFSGGPLKVLLEPMYEANPHNTYLDVGSALDKWTHGQATRPYHLRDVPSAYTNRNCVL